MVKVIYDFLHCKSRKTLERRIMIKSIKRSLILFILAIIIVFGVIFYLFFYKGDHSKKNSLKKKENTITVSVYKVYAKCIDEIKGDFEKKYKVKVKVKIDNMIGNLEKLPIKGPIGTAPDIMLAPYDRVGGLSSEGQIIEVKLPDEKDYDMTSKKLVTNNKKTYGVPFVIETLVLYYNKDLITNSPKTFNDLEKLNEDSKYNYLKEEGKSIGFLTNFTNLYFSYGLLSGYGGYIFGNEGTNIYDIGLGNLGTVEGLKYIKKWYDSWPKNMQDSKKSGKFIEKNFCKKRTAAIIEGPWAANYYKKKRVNYGVSKIPTLPNGNKYEAFAGGKAWVISSYSKEKDLSQKFIEYLSTIEHQKKLFDRGQEVPAGLLARKYAIKKGSELTKAVIDQFESDKPMPNISEMTEVWDLGEEMLTKVAKGDRDPSGAAKDIVNKIKRTLKDKYGE